MTDPTRFPPHAIAIVGIAGRFPGADDLEGFWRNVRDGVEALVDFTDADLEGAGVDATLRAHPDYVRRGTVLEGAELFDAGFFGLSPRESQILDPQQRIFLECAWEALEHAGYAPGTIDGAVGVYAGASLNTYVFAQILRDPALMAAVGGYQIMLGNDKDFLCTRASYKLDLKGPSLTIQTACSTSLVAVQVACRALERRECDLALAGGVSVGFPQRAGYLFQEGMILSPDGHCRPFDATARGTRPGAGAGIVVLKRVADALADGDTIHAVIRGAAINNDGAAKAGYTAPSIDGQVDVIATAMALAGVEPRSIGLIEAHGTATPLGDPIEIAALTQVFRAGTSDRGFCRLGSLKANLGHLDAAAGVAGLIKAVLTLKAREFPPLVNFTTPNPQLNLPASPFTASAEPAPWPEGPTPRRAGVSSFGIGGTNAHVVLEEAPLASRTPSAGPQLLLLSARSAAALDAVTHRLDRYLDSHDDLSLADVAWTLQVGRKAFDHRRALVAADVADAVAALRDPDGTRLASAVHEGGVRPVAFLFSGQGSQYAGMGADLYDSEPVYRAAIDTCADLLRPALGLDLREIVFASAGDARINDTRLAQPALFATNYALATLWQSWGVHPAAMLGHSIGEYVAAHVAGVMTLPDALALVAERGRLMQAMPPGGMAAVPLDSDELTRRLAVHRGAVEIAAINAPGMCTIAGPMDALADASERLAASGVDVRPLHTSHAFHSAMMEPVLAPFAERVATIALAAPKLPYVSNVTGTWVTPEQATSPSYWAEHLRRAVRFEAGVRTLADDAALHLLEVGPGHALASLARLNLGKKGARRVTASLAGTRDVVTPGRERRALLDAAGRLWLAGVPLDPTGMHARVRPRRVPLPTYPFERQRFAIDEPTADQASGGSVAIDPAHAAPATPARVAPTDGVYAATWTRDDALEEVIPRLDGHWLVVGHDGALASAVTSAVRDAGGHPIRIESGPGFHVSESADGPRVRVRPGILEDVQALAHLARERRQSIAGVIWLEGIEDPPAGDEANERSWAPHYFGPVAWACGLDVDASSPLRMVLATAGAHAVVDERVQRPHATAAFGPVLALPTEVPGLSIRLVDLAANVRTLDVDAAARALVSEAAVADRENLSAYRLGRRWLRRFERVVLPDVTGGDLPITPGAVVLVTGGTGGMGLAVARRLAERRQARVVLTSRTLAPPRESWDALLADPSGDESHAAMVRGLRAIEAAGGEVLTVAADAADRAAMSRALEAAQRRFGRIDVVVHAAGVPGGGRLAALKSAGEVGEVFAPKAQGLQVLVDLLGATPLQCVVLMSSINTVLGAAGLADYSAANGLLDAFVESAGIPPGWQRVLALDWGGWREVGMAARLEVPLARQAERQAFLRTAISTDEGLEVLERLLASRRRRVVVVPYDLHRALSVVREGGPEPHHHAGARVSGDAAGPARLADADLVAPQGDVEQQVAAIWVELLGVDHVGALDDFFALGGHSLLATRVLARIDQRLGARLALRDIFDAPTLRALARRVEAAAGRTSVRDEEREDLEF